VRWLLDTSVCVPLVNGTDRALAKRVLRSDPRTLVLCSVVKAELHFGARHSTRVAENVDRLERFCAAFQSLPFDDDAAEQYGQIRSSLQRAGNPIGANDLMIASTALATSSTLVTRNVKEFTRVPGLAVERW
jgi:tRNA(fMet)-specific endonuclease VapC